MSPILILAMWVLPEFVYVKEEQQNVQQLVMLFVLLVMFAEDANHPNSTAEEAVNETDVEDNVTGKVIEPVVCRLYGKQQDVNALWHSSGPRSLPMDPLYHGQFLLLA